MFNRTKQKQKTKTFFLWGRVLSVVFICLALVSASVKKSKAAKMLEAFNMAQTVTNTKVKKAKKSKMEIKSPSFGMNGFIPEEFSCKGNDANPPLVIENVPGEAKSLALIMDDPDAPAGTWVHWVMWDIPAGRTGKINIETGSVPHGAIQGVNSWGKRSYGGPCPPSGTHRYYFKLYALDTQLPLDPGSGKQELENAMKGHMLAHSELIGLFKK